MHQQFNTLPKNLNSIKVFKSPRHNPSTCTYNGILLNSIFTSRNFTCALYNCKKKSTLIVSLLYWRKGHRCAFCYVNVERKESPADRLVISSRAWHSWSGHLKCIKGTYCFLCLSVAWQLFFLHRFSWKLLPPQVQKKKVSSCFVSRVLAKSCNWGRLLGGQLWRWSRFELC